MVDLEVCEGVRDLPDLLRFPRSTPAMFSAHLPIARRPLAALASLALSASGHGFTALPLYRACRENQDKVGCLLNLGLELGRPRASVYVR